MINHRSVIMIPMLMPGCSVFNIIFILLVVQNSLKAQSGLHKLYNEINNASVDTSNMYSFRESLIDTECNINYVDPLRKLLKLRNVFEKKGYIKDFYYEAGILFGFVGDYKNALCFFDSSENVTKNKIVHLTNKADSKYDSVYISDIDVLKKDIASHRIVLLNESHHKVVNRLFAYSLLDMLKVNGFTHIAIETLTNPPLENLSFSCLPITAYIGTYTIDPMMAEFVRHAIKLGFTLVPYEHVGDFVDREVMQAYNISKVIQNDPTVKLFVYAGYGHIEKGLNDYKPMAYFLKMFTRINPLSINQEIFTYGDVNSASQRVYSMLTKRNILQKPGVLMKNNKYFFYNKNYDLFIIHPKPFLNSFRNSLNKSYDVNKKPIMIKTRNKNCFLVQAYYKNECNINRNIDSIVPADQTYDVTTGYELLLKKGNYYIVERDINYKFIKKTTLTVN